MLLEEIRYFKDHPFKCTGCSPSARATTCDTHAFGLGATPCLSVIPMHWGVDRAALSWGSIKVEEESFAVRAMWRSNQSQPIIARKTISKHHSEETMILTIRLNSRVGGGRGTDRPDCQNEPDRSGPTASPPHHSILEKRRLVERGSKNPGCGLACIACFRRIAEFGNFITTFMHLAAKRSSQKRVSFLTMLQDVGRCEVAADLKCPQSTISRRSRDRIFVSHRKRGLTFFLTHRRAIPISVSDPFP